MQADIKKQLHRILFLQNVAGARNMTDMGRLEALFNDCVAIVNDETPSATEKLVESTRLPDRC